MGGRERHFNPGIPPSRRFSNSGKQSMVEGSLGNKTICMFSIVSPLFHSPNRDLQLVM